MRGLRRSAFQIDKISALTATFLVLHLHDNRDAMLRVFNFRPEIIAWDICHSLDLALFIGEDRAQQLLQALFDQFHGLQRCELESLRAACFLLVAVARSREGPSSSTRRLSDHSSRLSMHLSRTVKFMPQGYTEDVNLHGVRCGLAYAAVVALNHQKQVDTTSKHRDAQANSGATAAMAGAAALAAPVGPLAVSRAVEATTNRLASPWLRGLEKRQETHSEAVKAVSQLFNAKVLGDVVNSGQPQHVLEAGIPPLSPQEVYQFRKTAASVLKRVIPPSVTLEIDDIPEPPKESLWTRVWSQSPPFAPLPRQITSHSDPGQRSTTGSDSDRTPPRVRTDTIDRLPGTFTPDEPMSVDSSPQSIHAQLASLPVESPDVMTAVSDLELANTRGGYDRSYSKSPPVWRKPRTYSGGSGSSGKRLTAFGMTKSPSASSTKSLMNGLGRGASPSPPPAVSASTPGTPRRFSERLRARMQWSSKSPPSGSTAAPNMSGESSDGSNTAPSPAHLPPSLEETQQNVPPAESDGALHPSLHVFDDGTTAFSHSRVAAGMFPSLIASSTESSAGTLEAQLSSFPSTSTESPRFGC